MASYRYYAGDEGRCYCYARDATYRCPYAEEAEAGGGPLSAELAAALKLLKNGPEMTTLLKNAHRSTRHMIMEVTCRGCGAPAIKLGYRTWIEAPIDQVDLDETTRRLNTAFGSTHMNVPGSSRYWPTKREAIAWAREEASIDRQSSTATR